MAEDIDGARVPGAVGTVWDGPSEEATQIVDLTDADGVPIIQLVADERGFVPSFYGPADDTERLWVDFGVGKIALVSVTVGDRLKVHMQAADPHQDRAYTDERLSNYVPRSGASIDVGKGSTWTGFTVADLEGSNGDTGGYVFKLETTGKTPAGYQEFTRLKNNGTLMLDSNGSHVPLLIGQYETVGADGSALAVSRGRAGTDPVVFRVRSDGRVEAAGDISASNIGNARIYSGPSAPASPQAGDVWVKYG
ncbi:hypothetical protein H9W91_07320 [Streptomyces alfalfae]|uniref:hypothetical protein n=1 Tax=Streptomyces alfalfae TaxID=1642299 RepID=UPI001BAD8746|nr:hypothetical protein [Streptomyces alfalfae]QUI30689.1 hypothetical protein H9W91_07320 [Streptomyces alfalfae]